MRETEVLSLTNTVWDGQHSKCNLLEDGRYTHVVRYTPDVPAEEQTVSFDLQIDTQNLRLLFRLSRIKTVLETLTVRKPKDV